jgi:hypothetical protein
MTGTEANPADVDTADTSGIPEPDETVADLPPSADEEQGDDDMFPREVVEKLRQENGKYRQRAQAADAYGKRLHTELVKATGRLADPTDLEFAEEHLEDPDALAAAVDDLLARKPHLASRKPAGDIGQGNRGGAAEPFSLLGLLKERT